MAGTGQRQRHRTRCNVERAHDWALTGTRSGAAGFHWTRAIPYPCISILPSAHARRRQAVRRSPHSTETADRLAMNGIHDPFGSRTSAVASAFSCSVLHAQAEPIRFIGKRLFTGPGSRQTSSEGAFVVKKTNLGRSVDPFRSTSLRNGFARVAARCDHAPFAEQTAAGHRSHRSVEAEIVQSRYGLIGTSPGRPHWYRPELPTS